MSARESDGSSPPDLQREIARVASREGLEVVEIIEALDVSGGDP